MQQNIDNQKKSKKKIRCNWVEMSFSVHLGNFDLAGKKMHNSCHKKRKTICSKG